MAELAVENLVKRHGAFTAIKGVSFDVKDGEFVTLLGPSGCGKSTTLAAIAGLDHPSEGVIRAGTRDFFNSAKGIALPAEARNCGLVFQAYALWPHMRVKDNVALPLKLRKVARPERDRLVEETLTLVEMNAYADRYPHELSGGQQQRVALARTLVYKPDVLLLDEPLSNLDSKLRERARTWLSELHRRVRQTTIYVTHDQIEALALSDRIIVMNGGEIVQVGTPGEIYTKPATAFVADFIGTSTFLSGVMAQSDAGLGAVRLKDGQHLEVSADRLPPAGTRVTAAIRPERLELGAAGSDRRGQSGTTISAAVTAVSYLGARFQYDLDICGEILKVESLEKFDDPVLSIWIPATACTVFPA
jgi:iron(III) transport system ATP-binding protein